jgi:mannitol-1-phosphate 5-dehydrogenase
LHRVLAEGLRRKAARGGPRAVVYCAENNNHAAEILERAVLAEVPETERAAVAARVRFLNTVVGKMSGILTDPREIRAAGLATLSAEDGRAFLVEAFNRILIAKIQFPDGAPFERGLRVFEEKPNLLPFEEAKLFGHNATHALAAALALTVGLETMAELPRVAGMIEFLRAAFLEESGAALIAKYQGVDPLFTPAGFRAYAEDLLARMTNPHLLDRAERVGRDPRRKLAWDDRLIGTMRLALSQGIEPERYALGAAAALWQLDGSFLDSSAPARKWLEPLWAEAPADRGEQERVLALVEAARERLARWRAAHCPNLADFLGEYRGS